jgi:1-acyl-sn-glycerol-3-phosphate acyltransferase
MRALVYHIIRLILVIYCRIWHRYRTYHADRLPPKGKSVLIAANHASYLDPVLVGVAFPYYIWYLARSTLFERSKVFGWMIKVVYALPITRERLDMRTIRQVQGICAEGGSVLVFPEGTRTKDGNLQKGQAGVGLFAEKINTDILPVYIHGSFEAMSRHAKLSMPRRLPISVSFGPLLPISKWKDIPAGRQRYEAIASDIMAEITKLREERVADSRS